MVADSDAHARLSPTNDPSRPNKPLSTRQNDPVNKAYTQPHIHPHSLSSESSHYRVNYCTASPSTRVTLLFSLTKSSRTTLNLFNPHSPRLPSNHRLVPILPLLGPSSCKLPTSSSPSLRLSPIPSPLPHSHPQATNAVRAAWSPPAARVSVPAPAFAADTPPRSVSLCRPSG